VPGVGIIGIAVIQPVNAGQHDERWSS
jgi:hypothetical protein